MHTRKLTVLIALTMLAGMAQADTQAEIRDVVKANIAHTNKTMTQDLSRISKEGSKEFFSSGGLLNTLQRKIDTSHKYGRDKAEHQTDKDGA